MSKFQNHFSPRKKSFFDPIFFLVKNMYLDFTIKAVRKRFAQMVHFRSTIPRNLLLASFIQCGLHMIDLSEVEPETIENETFLIIFRCSRSRSLERLYWSDPFQILTKPTSERMDCSKKIVFKKKFFFATNFCFQKMNINSQILLYRRRQPNPIEAFVK